MLPRWISWLFLVFLAYMLYHTGRSGRVEPPHPAELPSPASASQAASLEHYPHLAKFTEANRWKRALNPNNLGDVRMADMAKGEGVQAQCGDTVTVKLTGLENQKDATQPLTFRLGAAPYPVLNEALIGMRAGGERQIKAAPRQVYGASAPLSLEDVTLHAALQSIEAQQPSSRALGPKIIVEREGEGKPSFCGETLSLNLILWDGLGDAAYRSPTAWMVAPGKDALPPELTLALLGMRAGEIRTVVLPPQDTAQAKTIPPELRKAFGQLSIFTVERKG